MSPLESQPRAQPWGSVSWEQKWLLCSTRFCAFVSSLKLSRRLLCTARFVFVSTFNLPTRKSICRWNHQFEQIGCLCKGKSSGRPRVPEEYVRWIQESFERSPLTSARRVSRELGIPQPTVWRVLMRRLLFNWAHLFESRCSLIPSTTREISCYDNIQMNQIGFDVVSDLYIQKLKYVFCRQFVASVYKQEAILFYLTGNNRISSGAYIEFWSFLNEKCLVFLRNLYQLGHGNCLMNWYAKIVSRKKSVVIFYGYFRFTHLCIFCFQY